MYKYKYIIFDLDGTLINSTHKIFDIIERYFLDKYPDYYEKAIYYFRISQGQSLQEQLLYIFEDKKLAIIETKNIYSILSNLRNEVSFFPGIVKKIKELSLKRLSKKSKIYIDFGFFY